MGGRLKRAIIGVEHATALVGGPAGLVVVFVAESDDVLPRVLDIALSAAKDLLDLGSSTWVTPLIAVARHMEEGVVEHDGMGVDVVRARHLGGHLALMPVHEPAPAPHIVPGATGPRRRRIAEIYARHAVDLDAAEALFGIDLSASQRGR
jgi:hypothetical protein